MGLCASTPEASRESTEIDKVLEADGKRFRKECKILLLGSGDSGKSTIVKQMKIIHQGGYSATELDTWIPIVWRNVLECARVIAEMAKKLEHGDEKSQTQSLSDIILSVEPHSPLTRDLARTIHTLFLEDAVQNLLEDPLDDCYLPDSATYFFSEVLRISADKYRPTEIDVLRARATTTAITETRFTSGQLEIHMFDVGGQRSERRKWIHMFEAVTSIIFCVALSEYDQTLPALEDPTRTNRLAESLTLFESIVNSRWFLRTSIVLFLNKTDVFKRKVKRVLMSSIREFKDYEGGKDVNKAAKYILWRFMKKNRAGLRVYPHLTQATDTENIRFVFSAVKETILQNALQDSGLM